MCALRFHGARDLRQEEAAAPGRHDRAIDFGRNGGRSNAISPGSIERERSREYVADKPELEQELISYN